jgi:hypothetical protein
MRPAVRSLGSIVLASLLVCVVGTPRAAETPGAEFPGHRGGLTSPEGRYVVLNIDSQTENQVHYLGDNHALYLVDLKVPSVKRVHAYGRSASVRWSPKGSAFFINDRTGSNSSNVIVFVLARGTALDISKELKKRVQHKSITGNDHVYLEATEWLAENIVKIKVHGYGDVDPKGFELWYEYVIGGPLRHVSVGP